MTDATETIPAATDEPVSVTSYYVVQTMSPWGKYEDSGINPFMPTGHDKGFLDLDTAKQNEARMGLSLTFNSPKVGHPARTVRRVVTDTVV